MNLSVDEFKPGVRLAVGTVSHAKSVGEMGQPKWLLKSCGIPKLKWHSRSLAGSCNQKLAVYSSSKVPKVVSGHIPDLSGEVSTIYGCSSNLFSLGYREASFTQTVKMQDRPHTNVLRNNRVSDTKTGMSNMGALKVW